MSPLLRVPACVLASAAMLISPLASAAPPAEAPAEPAAPASGEPVEPVDIEIAPAPEPVPDPAPEPEPALPSWDAELPSHDAPIAAPPSPERPTSTSGYEPEPRPDGHAQLAVGGMLAGGGLILAVSSGLLLNRGEDPFIWLGGGIVSMIALASSIPILIVGGARRKSYEPWRVIHHPPPSGSGMLAAGALATSAGAIGMIIGGVSLTQQDADDLPYGEVLLSLGATSIATGLALVIFGAKRRRQFDAWNRSRAVPSFSLLSAPGAHARPTGATFGITGTF